MTADRHDETSRRLRRKPTQSNPQKKQFAFSGLQNELLNFNVTFSKQLMLVEVYFDVAEHFY